jgi:hypothetical protein
MTSKIKQLISRLISELDEEFEAAYISYWGEVENETLEQITKIKKMSDFSSDEKNPPTDPEIINWCMKQTLKNSLKS